MKVVDLQSDRSVEVLSAVSLDFSDIDRPSLYLLQQSKDITKITKNKR